MDGLVRKMGIGVGWDIDDSGLVQANEATDGLVDSAGEAEDSMDGLSSAGEEAGEGLTGAFEDFKGTLSSGIDRIGEMKGKLTAMAAAGTAAITQTVRMAGDLEERMNTLNREFGQNAREVEDWARSYADATELSQMQLVDWSATLGINLRQLDLTQSEMAGLTQEMIELTHNFAHFVDTDPESAFQSIHQAIRGGRFPRELRDLTGQIRQTDIETRALNEGLIEQGEEMDMQTERLATLSLLQEELAITQGAAAEGQEEMNTQFGRFRGLIGDISRDIGMMFLPTFNRGLGVVNNFLTTMRENRLAQVAGGFLAITTAVAGLGAGIGIVSKLGAKISGLVGAGAGLLGVAKGPFLAIIALLGGIALAIEDLWVGFQGGESVLFEAGRNVKEFVQALFTFDTEYLRNEWGLFANFFTNTADWILKHFNTSVEEISSFISRKMDDIKRSFVYTFGFIGDMSIPMPGLEIEFSDVLDGIRRDIEHLPNIYESLKEKWQSFRDWEPELPNLSETLRGWWGDITDFFDNIVNPERNIKESFSGFSEWVPELPDILGVLQNWWGDALSWSDDNISISRLFKGLQREESEAGLIDRAVNFLGFGSEQAESEAAKTQESINRERTNVTNDIDISEIKVEAADDPEQTAVAVRKELETFLKMEAAEAGAK